MKIELNTLRDILRSASIQLFSDRATLPKYNAQQNLEGRTHYVDDSTLRYFHSRITSAHDCCSGTLFYVIESTALDPDNTSRGFRGVVFDVWGSAIYRPDLQSTFRTSQGASKALYEWLNGFDVPAYYANNLRERAYRLEDEALGLRNAARAIVEASEVQA
jgi:hypothetical protein